MIRPALFLLTAACAAGHPEIEGALGRLNAEIAARPRDAALFVQRGLLYARHQDALAAEANFLRAAELNPAQPGLARAQGELALAGGDAEAALRHLDQAVAADPADADARVLRARARRARGDRPAAAADLDHALQLLAHPDPALLLERAALATDPAAELAVLQPGIDALGPVPSLELRALALERQLGRTAAALARLERLAAAAERPELWLRQRGDILREAGRPAEAAAAYGSALAALARLPDWLQASPASRALAEELRSLTAPSS